jgi:hypothetical protein
MGVESQAMPVTVSVGDSTVPAQAAPRVETSTERRMLAAVSHLNQNAQAIREITRGSLSGAKASQAVDQ